METHAGSAVQGLQKHSSGWRARLRLGDGRVSYGPVRLFEVRAIHDLTALSCARKRSLLSAVSLVERMHEENRPHQGP